MPGRKKKDDISIALRNTMALVLAGGRGSRLMHLTSEIAKPALPFAGKFRIIDFTLSNCINSGIRRVAVMTQFNTLALIQHVHRGWGFLKAELQEFIEVWPAQQQIENENWYLGTADAVYQNIAVIKAYGAKYILVLAGDHVYKQNYGKMLFQHMEREAEATVACVDVPIADARGFGVVVVDENHAIISFVEKPQSPPCIPDCPDRTFASMGIYIFNADFLYGLLEQDAKSRDSTHDFGKDLLPSLVGKCRLYAHRFNESCIMNDPLGEPYWRDVGTIDAYWKANMDLTKVTPELDLYDASWPIWTYQIQLPSAKFVFDDDDRRGMAVDSLVSGGCIVSGGAVKRSLLFSNVRVNSFCLIEDTVVMPGVNTGRGAVIRKAIIASDCNIPAGLAVGEDAELDARRFYRTEGGITLITKEMLGRL